VSADDIEKGGTPPEAPASDPAVPQSEVEAFVAAFEAKERRAQGLAPAESLDPLAGGALRPTSVVAMVPSGTETSDMDSLIRRASIAADAELEASPPDSGIDGAFEELAEVAAAEPIVSNAVTSSARERSDAEELLVPASPDSEAEQAMDETALGVPEDSSETVVAPLDFDSDERVSLVGADPMDEVLAILPETEPSVPEITAAERAGDDAAGLGAAAPILDSISDTTIIEEIGSENVAAGAAGAEAAMLEPPKTEAKAPSPAPAAATVKSKKGAAATEATVPAPSAVEQKARWSWLPQSPLKVLLEQPIRAAAALGLGVFVSVLTVAFLSGNPLRRHEVAAGGAAKEIGLERAVRTAEALVEQHDYKGAIALISVAMEYAKPDEDHYADALFIRAEAMVKSAPERLREVDANALHVAIDDAVEAGHEHPKTGEALMWKAQIYEREGNIPAARAELRGILENYGQIASRDAVFLAMAELELRTKNYEESLDAAERLVSEHPGSRLTARARMVQGDAYVARGNPKAARAVYMLATAEHPDSAVAMAAGERLGKLALESGQPEAAIAELERRLDIATTVEGNDAVYLVLARAYRATGQLEKARNVLNEILEFFPESEITPGTLVELSEVLDGLGAHAEAGRMADQAAQRYPTNPDVLRRAGEMLAERGQPIGAAEKFIAAYDAGAHEAGVLLSAADYYLKGGAPKEAEAAYSRVVEEHGGTAEAIDAQLGWARAARGEGELEGAFTRLQDLANANAGRPSVLPVLRELASLYRELGLTGEMIETYGKVVGITDEPAPLAEAARALIEAGAADEGLQVAQRVDIARLDAPEAYGLLEAWGRTLLRGNADAAMTLLMRAHEQYPEQRTAEGVEGTLRAALTLGRGAQARALVVDLQSRAAAPEHAADRPVFERAAVLYADYLFGRGDYAAADEAYAMIDVPPVAEAGAMPIETAAATTSSAEKSDAQEWSAYQRANAVYGSGRLAESLSLYEAVAASGSPYVADARARVDLIRFELRRRGAPDLSPAAEPVS